MLQHTIYSLGVLLKTIFEVPTKYSSPEGIFNALSESRSDIVLPCITFMDASIDINPTNLNRKNRGPLGAMSATNNSVDVFDIRQVNCVFNIGLISSTLDSHFSLVTKYFNLGHTKLTVKYVYDGTEYPIDLSISELSGLSNDYKTGKDYDIGEYHVRTGSFKLSSFIMTTTHAPIIREINVVSNGMALTSTVVDSEVISEIFLNNLH